MLSETQPPVISTEWEIPEQTYTQVLLLAEEREVKPSAIALAALERETQVREITNLHIEIAAASTNRLHELRKQQCSALGAVRRAIEVAPQPETADTAELGVIWQNYLHQLTARKVLCQPAIGLLTAEIDARGEHRQSWQERLDCWETDGGAVSIEEAA